MQPFKPAQNTQKSPNPSRSHSELFCEGVKNQCAYFKRVSEMDLFVDQDERYPTHVLIESDNLSALSALEYAYKERVDLIYIDPP